jgi:periplasmic divalent cation tolerance protein
MNISLIVSTFPNAKEARKVAMMLLKERLVACATILNKAESFYWWKGKIERGKEVVMIIKTRKNLTDKVYEKLRVHHPYTVPEIIELNVSGGNKEYIEWVYTVTGE